MRLREVFIFLTLVLPSMGKGSPSTEVKPNPAPSINQEAKAGGEVGSAVGAFHDSLQVSPGPKDEPVRIIPKQKLFDQVMQFELGFLSGKNQTKDLEASQTNLVGLQRVTYKDMERAEEIGLSLYDNSVLSLHYHYKWIWQERSFYEPNVKIGLVGFYEGSKGFGNLVDYNRYAVTVGVGFEDLLNLHRRLGFGLRASYGNMGASLEARFSFSLTR